MMSFDFYKNPHPIFLSGEYMMRLLLLSLIFLFVAACPMGPTQENENTPSDETSDGGSNSISYPAPLTDFVNRVGGPTTIDVATWNLENFPMTSQTPEQVANIIASLDLDLLGVQEIGNVDAFEELLARLPYHDGFLSSHTYVDGAYQKVGFIWRTDILSASNLQLIFNGSFNAFPRPPLLAKFTTLDDTNVEHFWAITVHLKAGTSYEERDRRIEGVQKLHTYANDLVAAEDNAHVILLGDFNERLDSNYGDIVFEPFLENSADYSFLTAGLHTGAFSYIWSSSLIDHMIVTTTFLNNNNTLEIMIPRLEQELDNYTSVISDHLPVVTLIH